MTKIDYINYWKVTAQEDWEVTQILFEKKKYLQALFFGHLVLEKLLKAHWVKDNTSDFPPKIHNLIRLAAQTQLEISDDDIDFFDTMNSYQMEGRYPDHQFAVLKTLKKAQVEKLLKEINRIKIWLIKHLN